MSRIRNSTSQMQPHFLYNALGSIQEVLQEDPQYASELIEDFTIHLRSCIRAMNSDAPQPFSMELDNIRAYVNIERMRFGEKLKIRYEIETDDFPIVPLSVQPLVENAIRHGIYQKGPAGGTVVLRTRDAGNAWQVEVEDNGVGFDVNAYRREAKSGKRDSTGLKNIIFRLDKVMHAHVDIVSTVGSGTKVTVTIPKGGSGA
jgi:Putative regulator of cell autolysis